MSYGIEILNNNDRILVDDTYANFGLKSTTYTTQNLAAGTPPNETITYPNISGAVANDLIIARTGTNDNGTLARGLRSTTVVYWEAIIGAKVPSHLDHPDTAVTNILRDMGSLYTPSTSGYGLEVYKSNGGVAFTSNISKHFTILATGNFNSNSSGVTSISFPSATTSYSDLSNVYVVLNPCLAWELDLGGFGYTLSMNGYQYEWTSSTAGRIHIHNLYYRRDYPNPSQNGYFTRDLDFSYLILREVG